MSPREPFPIDHETFPIGQPFTDEQRAVLVAEHVLRQAETRVADLAYFECLIPPADGGDAAGGLARTLRTSFPSCPETSTQSPLSDE